LSFFNELKRRNVFKVGVAYIIVAWLVAQVLQLIFESFGTPSWAIKTVLVPLAAGLPLVLFFAWAYEMTPEGIKRKRDVDRSQPITCQTVKKLKGTTAASRKLHSLIYKSRCKGSANWDLVDSILASSAQNNPANGITGVLVASEMHFLQVLAGEYESQNATFERISRDKRHDKVQLISFTEIEQRKFADWAMRGIGLFDLNHKLAVRLCKTFGEDSGNVRFRSTESEVMDSLNMLLPEERREQAHI